MENDATIELLKRIERGYSLPTLSPVAVKLVEIASDDTCSIHDLISLIEKDPSLTVNLLRMANSSFFRTGQPIAVLQQAIMRIGFHQLRVMGLSLSLRNTFPMGKVGSLDYENFWRISLYRGLLAKSLAGRLKSCNPDEAFVAGLILEIGFLIFYDLFLKGRQEETAVPDLNDLQSLIEWERETYGTDHRSLGGAALKYWQFPDTIVECQIGYNEALSVNAPPLTKICELARMLSGAMLHRDADIHLLFQGAWETQGFSDEVIHGIIVSAFEEVEEIAASLRLELNKEKDLMEIMEKANRSLGRISEKIAQIQDEAERSCLPSFDGLRLKETNEQSVEYAMQAVAHEIRNPLVSVAGFAKRLAQALDPASEGGKYVKIILDEALRLEAALSNITR